MNIDKVDIELINILNDTNIEKKMSTTDLAKKIFTPDDRKNMISYNSLVTSKLKKLIDYNIISREKSDDDCWIYYIDEDDLLITEGAIEFEYPKGDGLKKAENSKILFLPKETGMYVIAYFDEKKDV